MTTQRYRLILAVCNLPRTSRAVARITPPRLYPSRCLGSLKSTRRTSIIKSSPCDFQCRGAHNRPAVMQKEDEFHNYTRGCFVVNESHEMMLRYAPFDMNALAQTAAKALKSQSCFRVTKFADGMYNKAFLLVMDDGKECVAKIPNPNAGPAHFTTASDVATMDLMSNVLGTPAPKVYAWCSRVEETAVGAEFIIMEKMEGEPLDQYWGEMSVEDRWSVTKSIASFQLKWADVTFKGYGGIYYRSDLSDTASSIPCDLGRGQFAIGPTTGREWADDRRRPVQFDCGPWVTTTDYLTAVGRREAACVENLERLPKSPIGLYGPGTYFQTREAKLRALEYYLALLPYLCPDDSTIKRPCIWHGDLHRENIIVDPVDPTQITGIIDWQSTEIVPMFEQARQPYFLDFDGPQPKGLELPRLPSNFAELPAMEQRKAEHFYWKQSLITLYRIFMEGMNPKIWECFEFQETPACGLLKTLARRLLIDGEATYMARILELAEASRTFAGVDEKVRKKYLDFTASDKARILADVEGASHGMDIMQRIKDALGDLFPERGVVRPERYHECKDALRQVKAAVIAEFSRNDKEREDWAEVWPFDD